MRINLQAAPKETVDKEVADMTDTELFTAHNSRVEVVKAARAEQVELHLEITRREHKLRDARLHLDRTLDQGVRLG